MTRYIRPDELANPVVVSKCKPEFRHYGYGIVDKLGTVLHDIFDTRKEAKQHVSYCNDICPQLGPHRVVELLWREVK